jgi:hypothetical protein
MSGHYHHHHHSSTASSDPNSTFSTSSSSSTLDQLLASFQAGAARSDSLNPMSIILNTLSTSGIGVTGS